MSFYLMCSRIIKACNKKSFSKLFRVLLCSTSRMIGGSADLTGSNNTLSSSNTELLPESPEGTHIYYGVREFGMAGITNGDSSWRHQTL